LLDNLNIKNLLYQEQNLNSIANNGGNV
jgi:hypothetical protein